MVAPTFTRPAHMGGHTHRHTHTLTYPYAHSDLIAHQNPNRPRKATDPGESSPHGAIPAGAAGVVPAGGGALVVATGGSPGPGAMVVASPPRLGSGGAEGLIALIQGRWASGGGLLHRIEGDLVTNERTGVTSRFERPTGNLVMLMGVAIKPFTTTHDRIEWADADVWARAAEDPVQITETVTEVVEEDVRSPWRRHRVGSGKAMAQGYGYFGTGWLGTADVSSIIGQERSCEYFRHGLSVDTHRRRVRTDCREWETDTSPLRNRPSNHPHIEMQLGIQPQVVPPRDYRGGRVPMVQ